MPLRRRAAGIPSAVRQHRIRIFRLAALCLVPALIFVRSAWEPFPTVIEGAEVVGTLFIFVGILGRFWAILYSGGRKNRVVVTDGPYSVCRHPLYFFSIVAIVGFGILVGSLVVAFALGVLTAVFLHMTARTEEETLIAMFGEHYLTYRQTVPSIVPDARLFRTAGTVTVFPGELRNTLRDALGFLALIPLAEVLSRVSASRAFDTVALW